jgi:hypothetical protein
MVVDRRQLKATIATLLSVLMHKRAAAQGDSETIELSELASEDGEAPAKSTRKPAKQQPRAKAAE